MRPGTFENFSSCKGDSLKTGLGSVFGQIICNKSGSYGLDFSIRDVYKGVDLIGKC